MKLFSMIGWGFYCGVMVLLFGVTLFASSSLPKPYSAYIVKSGSMEPTIMTGDIVIDRSDWKPSKDYVITFLDEDDHLVTHRIIEEVRENGELLFRTKGDNNEDPDPDLIHESRVKGVWYANLSYLGYFAVWLQRPVVILIVIFLPLTLLMTIDALRDQDSKKSKSNN